MALNIYQRLAAVMNEVDYVQKEKKQGMRYSIVTHDAVTAKVRPALLRNGIVYHPINIQHQQVGNRTEVGLVVRFVNVDEPSEFFDVPSLGFGIDDQDKGPGKAISYAVKYALLKTLGMETGDDPDLDQDVTHKHPDVEKIKNIGEELRLETTLSGLDAALTVHREFLSASNTKFPAAVALVRQIYQQRKKELS